MTIDICPDYGEDINRFVEEIEQLNARIAELEAELKNARELIGMTPEPAFPAWIPVSERLPEEDGEYWVWFDDDFTGIKISGYCDYSKQNGWDNTERVTHWMPLPEPPEARDERI